MQVFSVSICLCEPHKLYKRTCQFSFVDTSDTCVLIISALHASFDAQKVESCGSSVAHNLLWLYIHFIITFVWSIICKLTIIDNVFVIFR